MNAWRLEDNTLDVGGSPKYYRPSCSYPWPKILFEVKSCKKQQDAKNTTIQLRFFERRLIEIR